MAGNFQNIGKYYIYTLKKLNEFTKVIFKENYTQTYKN